jgi:membrane protease YdiL (CAAX protease family)
MSNDTSKPVLGLVPDKQSRVAVTPSRAPWNIALGLIFIVVVFFGAQLAGGLLASLYVRLFYGTGVHAKAILTTVPFQFFFILLAETFTIFPIVLFLRRYKLSLSYLGLKKPRLRDPLYGALAIPVYYFLFAILAAIATWLYPALNVTQKQELGFDSVVGTSQLILTFFSLVVLPPLAEEILFRGFIYKTLRKSLSFPIAMVITSLLFGAGHLAEGGTSGPLYIGALQTFSLSLVLVYLREKTDSLWPSITLHASNNLIAFIYLFVLHRS